MSHLFIFGFGFCGRAVARTFLGQGWRVSATRRSSDEAAFAGVAMHLFDRAHRLPAGCLAGVTHVLSTVPPDENGDPVLDTALDALLRAAPAWVGYLSTTGVYGDRGGAWVDEESPIAPINVRSERRAAAERAWLGSGLPAHLFRLAGIYGPGRSPLDKADRRIIKPGHVFGRIHVEDVAEVIAASVRRPHLGRIYNVADDEPAEPQEVQAFAAALLGQPPPMSVRWEEAEGDLSPMARSFWAESKRVANARIKTELGVRLAYPTYREGLRALLAAR